MDLYTSLAYDTSRNLTRSYSTSFSKSITLFDKSIRKHIYAVYGLVRIADEIVDTYNGSDQLKLLKTLEDEVYEAIERGYSTNPIVHSFALSAKKYGINQTLIQPFFISMEMDLSKIQYDQSTYERYIYGSAEVVGLMCLRIFVDGDTKLYSQLQSGARALGAAYQKVNFLRDIATDYKELDRFYFPGLTYESFNDSEKMRVIRDIEKDIILARKSLVGLPTTSRYAVELSLVYYNALLQKLKRTPVDGLKRSRIRINDVQKIALLSSVALKRKLRHV